MPRDHVDDVPEDSPIVHGIHGDETSGIYLRRGDPWALREREEADADSLRDQIERLAWSIEKMNLAEYTDLLRSPWRLLWVNFLAGSARGLGLGIGFAILSAGVLYILRSLMVANLPVIGDFVATIVRMVETNLRP